MMQSAYKACHSTETALLKVHNDILRSIDRNEAVLLVLLDLSAAFDTVDHCILIKRLHTRLGITGNALSWCKSYLSNRHQKVMIKGTSSTQRALSCGVPQGSVLGPILFIVYILPLGDIVRRHGVKFQLYADDSQLYLSFKKSDINAAVLRMEHLISDIRLWMIANLVKCNDDKTEFMVLSSRFQPSVDCDPIKIGTENVAPCTQVRNLGVIMDSSLTLVPHVNQSVSNSFCQIRNLARVRRYLTHDAAVTAVHSFVTSRIDYCNSLLYGLSLSTVSKLQHVHNSAARLVTHTRKFDHITPVLKLLHWLPVLQRIQFKILLITYKALHGLAPKYLATLLETPRTQRLDKDSLLLIPKTKMVNYGDRSFSKAAPQLWNNLPSYIRNSPSVESFKKKLKTFMFDKAFFDREYKFVWSLPGGHPY